MAVLVLDERAGADLHDGESIVGVGRLGDAEYRAVVDSGDGLGGRRPPGDVLLQFRPFLRHVLGPRHCWSGGGVGGDGVDSRRIELIRWRNQGMDEAEDGLVRLDGEGEAVGFSPDKLISKFYIYIFFIMSYMYLYQYHILSPIYSKISIK